MATWLIVKFEDGRTAELPVEDSLVEEYTSRGGSVDWDALYGNEMADEARRIAGDTLADVQNLYGTLR